MLVFARNICFALCLLAGFPVMAANPQVEFETSRGSFVVELYPDKAPATVENFLAYVNSGFYNGTVFHRTIRKFVVQGGGLSESLEPKPTRSPIPNESNNGLSNDIGSLAMARGYKSDSATSQFFVNLEDNRFLNFYRREAGLEGYTVFGRVIRGLDVVMRISDAQTSNVGRLDHVPHELVVIRSSRLLDTPVLAENVVPEKPAETVVNKSQSSNSKSAKKGKKRG